MEESTTWGSGLAANVIGNILTVALAICAYLVREKCRRCKSKCDMPCCHISTSDKDRTIRRVSHPEPDPDRGERDHSQETGQAHLV